MQDLASFEATGHRRCCLMKSGGVASFLVSMNSVPDALVEYGKKTCKNLSAYNQHHTNVTEKVQANNLRILLWYGTEVL